MATLAWPCGPFTKKHAHDKRGHGPHFKTRFKEMMKSRLLHLA